MRTYGIAQATQQYTVSARQQPRVSMQLLQTKCIAAIGNKKKKKKEKRKKLKSTF